MSGDGEAEAAQAYPWLRLLLGPLIAALAYFVARHAGLASPAAFTAGVTAWCALWWVTEPVPIPVTSLLPFALFPLCGVLDHGEVAKAYGHTLILLLLGGFVLSTAMEKSGAHRRVALGMVRLVGGRGRRLVLGFMLATGLTSMWISNTATTLMMLPVALAVIERDESNRLAAPLLLGIGYASSIGGLGTPVGTPPNVIFMGVYKELTGTEVSFVDWMKIGVPVTL
ncbi:MAG: SLC13 family permease, partial [Polyangiaceae bacterium]